MMYLLGSALVGLLVMFLCIIILYRELRKERKSHTESVQASINDQHNFYKEIDELRGQVRDYRTTMN